MSCHGLWKIYVCTCMNLSLSPLWKGHFNLICVSAWCVCPLLSVSAACPQKQTNGSLQCFSFPVLKLVWLTLIVLQGGRDEPQLPSDVNAAQTLCSCGHSPSDSSNQLMGYLTLPSSPHQLTSAVSLNLVMDVAVKSEQMLRAHLQSEWKT